MLAALLKHISEAAGKLAPLSLGAPLAPVPPIQATLTHLTTSNVHDTLFPFRRLGALHAARVTTGWAALTRGRGDVGVLQDWVGYLTVAWGGGTLAALLTSTTPAWLTSPTPWLLYTAMFFLLVRTGLSAYIFETAPRLPFNLVMSAVDGLNRGMTITAMPALLARSPATPASREWWAAAVLGAIATNGGGWIAQTLGMHKQQWGLGRPAILNGGILPTLDVWGALVVSGVYAALARTSDSALMNRAGDVLASIMPDELRDPRVEAKATGQVLSNETARAVAVLVLGCLFAARAITVQVMQWRAERPVKTELVPLPATNGSEVVRSPVEVTSSPKPKKRKARKNKSPTP